MSAQIKTINTATKQTVVTSYCIMQDAGIAEAFLNQFCADNKGYQIPAFNISAKNNPEQSKDAKEWQALLLQSMNKASASNARVAINEGLMRGEYIGKNKSRVVQAEAKQDKVVKSSAGKGAKPAKSDMDKLKSYAKRVLESPALRAADFPTITREEWAAMLRCLTKIKA